MHREVSRKISRDMSALQGEKDQKAVLAVWHLKKGHKAGNSLTSELFYLRSEELFDLRLAIL